MPVKQSTKVIARKWLDREDRVARRGRLARLKWLAANMPDSEFLMFPGGLVSGYLFEEARYCFAYGQFMATVALGFAFLERTLASLFFQIGRNDLRRAPISDLLREGCKAGWLSRDEFKKLDKLRTLRNHLAHFRAPLAKGTIEYRAVKFNVFPYAVIEKDARKVMQAVFRLLRSNMIGKEER